MLPYMSEIFGNPGSLHSYGQKASAAVFEARQTIAKELGCHYSEIIFTGSATEANGLALRGTLKQFLISNFQFLKGAKPRIVISSIEHESILETARDLEKEGVEVVYIPVSKEGVVNLKKLKEALNERTVLVSVMYGNNEVGTIQPIAEISKIIRNWKLEIGNSSVSSPTPNSFPLLHSDAVQAFQYLDCNVNELGVDLMTLSGHKIYGPKGVGCLYVRGVGIDGIVQAQRSNKRSGPTLSIIHPITTGGGQEFGLRSGTENVPAIVGFAKAVSIATAGRKKALLQTAKLRDSLLVGLRKLWPKLEINGGSKNRLPNNLNIYIPGEIAEKLIVSLDLQGVAVSSGSACSARSTKPSHVLLALGHNENRAKNSVRVTLGRMTTKKEIDTALKILKLLKEKAG
jgi:cysteine desulfurase